jgi:uncharacterized protein YbjT (DUF2867 family)
MEQRDTGGEPVLVTGGTGTLGTHVVQGLREHGRQVRVLSRKQRASSEGVRYVVGDLATGAGVEDAVAGADVIIHCASDRKGDVEATRTLVKAATAQGKRPHLVYISIVGADGIRFSYFKAKLAAEKVIAGSSLPWTVQRATQFYDFVLSGAASMARFPIVAAPKDFICQPIDPADVAHQLVQLALGPPSGRVPDIGGPEVSTWADMIRQYLHAAGRRRLVVEVRMPGTGAIRAGGLLVKDPAAKPGVTTWQVFLASKLN